MPIKIEDPSLCAVPSLYTTATQASALHWTIFQGFDAEGRSIEMLAFHPTDGVRIYGQALSPTPENAAEVWKTFSTWMMFHAR
jgi:hypothetical protein